MRHYQRSLVIAAVLTSAACSSDDSKPPSSGDAGASGDSGSTDSGTGGGDAGGACAWRSVTVDGGAAVGSEVVATPFAAPNDTLTFSPPSIPCTIFKITDYGAVSTPLPADAGTGSDAAATVDAASAADGAGADSGSSGDGAAAGDAAASSDVGAPDAGASSDASGGDGASGGEGGAILEAGTAGDAAVDAAGAPDAGAATATGPIPANTQAFAAAIAAATAAGGGVVDVPAGTWRTGPIHLASNIELHLEAGATVLFSQNVNDYLPPVLTRWEGLDVMNWSPFVYALNATNVAITGAGTLDGQGSTWWSWKTPSKAEDQRIYAWWLTHLSGISSPPTAAQVPVSAVVNGLRPTMIECNGCTNFLIDGITTANPAYWVIHPLYSTNVIIRNAHITSNILGSNGDGIDVDSCKNVLIESDTFATSDDIISVKSGLNEVGIAVNKPTEELVIRNISANLGHALSFGSEMSGSINNVLVDNATLNNMQYLMRMKTMPGRGGVMSNVWFQNVMASNWTVAALEITTNYPSSTIAPNDLNKLPTVKNVTVKNVTGTSAPPYPVYNFVGLPMPLFSGIVLDTVNLTGAPGTCKTASGITVTNSMLGLPSGTTSIMCP
ncbi:MAG: glycosyl hydrolase family 28 protein [Myxococcota bacterium]|nr:glycosyl hydrolase family 28 protein [Myxococcota bacterium]